MKISEKQMRKLVAEMLSRKVFGRSIVEAGPTIKIASRGMKDSGDEGDNMSGLTPDDPSYWRELADQSLSLGGSIGEQTVESIVSIAQFTYSLVNDPASTIGAIEDSLITTKFRIIAKMSDATDIDAEAWLALSAFLSGNAREISRVANITKEDVVALKTGTLFHDMMGVVSMVPVGGILAAVVDAVVYSAEGDNEKAAQCFVLAGMMIALEAASAAPKPGTALAKPAAGSSAKAFTAAEEKYLAAQRLALRPSTEGERVAALKAMETMEKKTPSLRSLRDQAVDSPRTAPAASSNIPKAYDQAVRTGQKTGGKITIPPEQSASAIKAAQDMVQVLKDKGMAGASGISAEITAIGAEGSVSVAGLSAARATEALSAANTMLETAPSGLTVVEEAAKRDSVLVYKPVELTAADRSGSDWLDTLAGKVTLDTPEALALEQAYRDAMEAFYMAKSQKSQDLDLYKEKYESALSDYIEKGTRDPFPGEAAASQGTTPEGMSDLQKRAKTVLSSKAFSDRAKALYSRIGPDVNIIPIIGSHEAMFKKYLTGYPRYVAGTSMTRTQIGKRVVVTSAEEGRRILNSIEGIEVKSGDAMVPSRIDTSEIGPSNITIVPVTNAAGMDSMPTAWMISHGIFDSAAGSLLIDEGMLPRTKEIVDQVVKLYGDVRGLPRGESRLPLIGITKRYDYTSKSPDGMSYFGPDGERLEKNSPLYGQVLRTIAADRALNSFFGDNALGMTVNSGWARNSRTIFSGIIQKVEKISDISASTGGFFRPNSAFYNLGQKIGIDPADVEKIVTDIESIRKKGAPPVGRQVKSVDDLSDLPLQKTKQATATVNDYIFRGNQDHIAETMTAALTQPGGYQPDFSHLETQAAKDLFGEKGIEKIKKTAQKIQDVLGPGGNNIKEAFAEDMEGKVLFVFPD